MIPTTRMLMNINKNMGRCQRASRAAVQMHLLTVRHGLDACLAAVQAISHIRQQIQMVKSQVTVGLSQQAG